MGEAWGCKRVKENCWKGLELEGVAASLASHCDDRDAPTSRGAICPLLTLKIVVISVDTYFTDFESIREREVSGRCYGRSRGRACDEQSDGIIGVSAHLPVSVPRNSSNSRVSFTSAYAVIATLLSVSRRARKHVLETVRRGFIFLFSIEPRRRDPSRSHRVPSVRGESVGSREK